MIVNRITLVCPMCEEIVMIPFNELDMGWDQTLTLSFECPKCGEYIENETVEADED